MATQDAYRQVVEQYRKEHPARTEVRVSALVEGYHSGRLAVISAKSGDVDSEEFAFYNNDGTLRTFSSARAAGVFHNRESQRIVVCEDFHYTNIIRSCISLAAFWLVRDRFL